MASQRGQGNKEPECPYLMRESWETPGVTCKKLILFSIFSEGLVRGRGPLLQ